MKEYFICKNVGGNDGYDILLLSSKDNPKYIIFPRRSMKVIRNKNKD